MTSCRECLNGGLANGEIAPLSDDKIAFAWRSAVGPAIDRGTTITFAGGVLRVSAREPAWAREVERSEALIRARLDSMLGRGVVRTIDVVDGH